jgi:uncharacterized protein (DUF1499 family)
VKYIFVIVAAVAVLAAAGGPGLAYLRLLPGSAGLGLLALGGLLGLVSGIGGAWLLFRGHAAGGYALAGWVPALAVLVLAVPGFRYPPINDITTNPDDPPAFEAAAGVPANETRDLTYPADFAAVQREAYPDVRPYVAAAPPEDVYAVALRLAETLRGWRVIDSASPERIEAVAETPVFGFHDDIVLRFTPADGGTRVDMRSKSRVGRGDIGRNAQRITGFLGRLDGALGTGSDG